MLKAIVVLSSCLLSTACATRYEYVGRGTAGNQALWEWPFVSLTLA